MLEQIIQLDQSLFKLLNGQWHNAVFDVLIPLFRNKYFWIPLYVFLLGFIIHNFPNSSWKYLLLILLTIVLTDQLSSTLIKPWIDRCRPCNLEPFNEQVRLLVKCGSGRSFVSSHAANHFGLATILNLLFGKYFKGFALFLICWAAVISYGQVYVGVHFPLDIFCGALLGMCCGFLLAFLGKKTMNL